MRDPRPEPPAIVVLGPAGVTPAGSVARQVLAGIEEEGVPALAAADRGSEQVTGCVALAERAAERSSLQVGVGIGEDGVCVTHRALPSGTPIGRRDAPVPADEARRLGHDAARVVTGIPLKLAHP